VGKEADVPNIEALDEARKKASQDSPESKSADSNSDQGASKSSRKRTQAAEIADLVTAAGREGGGGGANQNSNTAGEPANDVLFHTPAREGGATFIVGDHEETWPIRSRSFALFMRRAYYLKTGKAASASTIADARDTLEARAIFDGPEIEMHTRVAGSKGAVYIDLCDDKWRVVEVDEKGWRVLPRSPIRFRRANGMLGLPTPVSGGTVGDLKKLLNVESTDDWALLACWCVAALNATGPYPLLEFGGEQGAAKSTAAKMLRGFIDPNAAPVRSEPCEERDLVIAAQNGRVIAFDNISSLPNWLSDALCRLATGGGFATRALYTDDEEKIFDAQRPVLLNGIEDSAVRGDLLERTIKMRLPQIESKNRKEERKLWADFFEKRPRILGAFLSALSVGLRDRDAVALTELPRMADFARLAVAAEPALGLKPGTFFEAYKRNHAVSNDVALDSALIWTALRSLLKSSPNWSGTAENLLVELNDRALPETKRQRGWPRTPRGASGQLRRIAPHLRAAGWGVEFEREGHDRTRKITFSKFGEPPSSASASSSSAKYQEKGAADAGQTATPSADGSKDGTPSAKDSGASSKKPSPSNRFCAADGADDETCDDATEFPPPSPPSSATGTPALSEIEKTVEAALRDGSLSVSEVERVIEEQGTKFGPGDVYRALQHLTELGVAISHENEGRWEGVPF
jgi:hypothetical protein